MPHSEYVRDHYLACNRTELYQLCMRVGLCVAPWETKEKLVAYILDEECPPPLDHPIDLWRSGLIGLIQDYWERLEAQLQCPAKDLGPPAKEDDPPKPDPADLRTPRACYRCTDARVMACVSDNPTQEHLIQIRTRPPQRPKESDDMQNSVMTLNTFPRSAAAMAAGSGVGRHASMRIYYQLVTAGAAADEEGEKVWFTNASLPERYSKLEEYFKNYDKMQGASNTQTESPATTTTEAVAPQRTPVNRRRTSSATEGQAAANSSQAQGGSDDQEKAAGTGPSNAEALAGMGTHIMEALSGLKLMVEGIGSRIDVLDARIGGLSVASASNRDEYLSEVQDLKRTVKLTGAVTLWAVENQVDAAPAEVLAQSGPYVTILNQALSGTGKG